jgi:hypothetical protein
MKLEKFNNSYHVYCLVKNGSPIYVGMSKNITKREKDHRKKKKDFDFVFIIKSFDNKTDALICENGIIRFISILNDEKYVNGLNDLLRLEFECISLYKSPNI